MTELKKIRSLQRAASELKKNRRIEREKDVLIETIVTYLQLQREKNAIEMGGTALSVSREKAREDVLFILAYEKNIKSVEDFRAFSLWEAFEDLYKELNGISPNWLRWYDHSFEEWQGIFEDLQEEV